MKKEEKKTQIENVGNFRKPAKNFATLEKNFLQSL